MVLSATTPSVRKSYGQIADKLEVGNLIQTQLDSFEWFKREGLRELFNEINPITDYTSKNYELRFLDYEFGDPKYDEEECRQRDMTFSAPLRINTRLHIKTSESAGESKTSSKDILTVKIDRKRKVPVTTLVRALGYATNEEIKAWFAEVDNDPEHQYISATLEKDASASVEEALVELYRKIRPGDPPT